jgi:hypothetical protein
MTNFFETFRWSYLNFDVTKINTDISIGALHGTSVVLPRPTIDWYSNAILAVTDPTARRFPQLEPINTEYAKGLKSPRIDEAVVLARIERSPSDRNERGAALDVPGTLCYDTSARQIVKPNDFGAADILVIDGNHRIAAAYYQSRKSVTGMLLAIDQLTKYLRN